MKAAETKIVVYFRVRYKQSQDATGWWPRASPTRPSLRKNKNGNIENDKTKEKTKKKITRREKEKTAAKIEKRKKISPQKNQCQDIRHVKQERKSQRVFENCLIVSIDETDEDMEMELIKEAKEKRTVSLVSRKQARKARRCASTSSSHLVSVSHNLKRYYLKYYLKSLTG